MPRETYDELRKIRSTHVMGQYIQVHIQLPPREVFEQYKDSWWWTADDKRYANYDPWAEFEQPSGSHLVIEVDYWKLKRKTPQGVMLAHRWFPQNKFLNLSWTRQWAANSVTGALEHLLARKRAHIAGAQARLHRAQQHYDAVANLLRHMQKGDDYGKAQACG